MQELAVIGEHRVRDHTILIDDVILFSGPDRDGVEWSDVTLESVIAALKRINADDVISYECGYLPEDVRVAQVPRR